VVLALEDGRRRCVLGARLGEALTELDDLRLEQLGLEELVRERDKVEVEEVVDLGALEPLGLAQTVPQAVQVGGEGRTEVGEGRGANVVADDEEEERLVLRAAREMRVSALSWARTRTRAQGMLDRHEM